MKIGENDQEYKICYNKLMIDLNKQHCIPCEGGAKPLSKEEAEAILAFTYGWTLVDDGKKISKDFVFADFKEAMVFVNKVAEISESEGHHPDIFVWWNKVTLVLWTHAVGGLTTNDFIIAAKINDL